MKELQKARMHTAEHVLNRTMVAMFGCSRSFSAHINAKKSKCDYHFDRALGDDEAKGIEDRVNEALGQGLDVTEEFMDRNLAEQRFDLARLPDSAGETLRIIHVGDFDACPCSGEHVANTREVGSFRIISHSFEANVLRIRFKLRQDS